MENDRAFKRPPGERPDPYVRRTEPAGETLGDTVTGIVEDLQNIVRGEVQLAKTELKEDASKIGKAVGMIAAGVMLGWAGFLFLMAAVTLVLDEWIDELWISAGIVAVVLLIIAAIIAMSGKSQLSKANLKPEATIESVKEDKEWASRQINSVKK